MASKTTATGDGTPVMVLRSGKHKRQGPHISSQRPTKKLKKSVTSDRPAANVAAPEPTWSAKACTICAEDKPLQDFPLPTEIPNPCRQHCLDICRICIRRSLARDIANRPLDRIGCPLCRVSWDHSTIQTHASAEDLATYDGLKLLRVLEAMPNYRACPNQDCTGGQIHAMGEAEPIVTCNECGFRSCYTHRVAWHSDLTCDAYDSAQGVGEETEEETRQRLAAEEVETRKGAPGVKLCPGCDVPIWKDGGCDHMTC